MSEKIGGHLGPLLRSFFFQKSADQISEIAILFTMVEKPNNIVFRDDLLTRCPRGRGCKLQTLTFCLHIVMVTRKCTDVFRGICFGLGGIVEGGYVGGYFHGETSHGGREFQ